MGEPANTVDSHCAGASRQLPQDFMSSMDLSSAEVKQVDMSVIYLYLLETSGCSSLVPMSDCMGQTDQICWL